MFIVRIDTGNDAFQCGAPEIARILRTIANDLESDQDPTYTKYRTVFDSNGNNVGTWKIDLTREG